MIDYNHGNCGDDVIGVGPGRYFETKEGEWVKPPGPQRKDPGHSFTGKARNIEGINNPGPADYLKE
jgi:hypothetical protein